MWVIDGAQAGADGGIAALFGDLPSGCGEAWQRAVQHPTQQCLELIQVPSLIDVLPVLQPALIDGDVPQQDRCPAGQGLQHHDPLGLLVAEESKGVGAAIGLP